MKSTISLTARMHIFSFNTLLKLPYFKFVSRSMYKQYFLYEILVLLTDIYVLYRVIVSTYIFKRSGLLLVNDCVN